MPQRRGIRPPAESHHGAPDGGRKDRALVDLVARPEIRDVDLDHRKRHRLDHIVQRDAAEGETGRVDQRPVDIVDVLLKRVHQFALGIRLQGNQLDVDRLREVGQPCVDLIERRRSVDLRLAAAEQIEVGAVEHQDLQPRLLRLRLRAGALGRRCRGDDERGRDALASPLHSRGSSARRSLDESGSPAGFAGAGGCCLDGGAPGAPQPNAMRTPISRVRRATAYAVMLKMPTSVSSSPKTPSIVSSSIRCLGLATCWLTQRRRRLAVRRGRAGPPIPPSVSADRSATTSLAQPHHHGQRHRTSPAPLGSGST